MATCWKVDQLDQVREQHVWRQRSRLVGCIPEVGKSQIKSQCQNLKSLVVKSQIPNLNPKSSKPKSNQISKP